MTTDPRKLQRAVARAEASYARACEARNDWLIDRINDGWTHQQISDALGISRGRVAAILKSSHKPALEPAREGVLMPVIEHPEDENVQALDRMADFALLPDHIKRLGEQLQRDNDALRCAATEVSDAWDAWMMHEEGEGMNRMENAIGALRAVLNAR